MFDAIVSNIQNNWGWYVVLGFIIFLIIRNAFFPPKQAPMKKPTVSFVNNKLALVFIEGCNIKESLTEVIRLEEDGFKVDKTLNDLYPDDLVIILRK